MNAPLAEARRFAKGWLSGIRLLRDPSRLDQVFDLEESLATSDHTRAILDRVSRHPEGARALAERSRLPTIDMPALRALPEGTLGHAFAAHMDALGLDPAAIPRREAGDDHGYVRAHLYETHDIWHVVFGFGADIAGELGLQAAYFAQLRGALPPLLVTGGLLHGILWAPDDWPARFDAVIRGATAGAAARPLFGIRWDERWADPLAEVRAELAIVA